MPSEVAELVKVLSRALRTLGNDGQVDAASRLAAQAWVLCRDRHPDAAERLNGLMHYLARLDSSPVDHHRVAALDAESEE